MDTILEDNRLYTRAELRELGLLNYAPMSFLRWEKDNLLTPVKPGGRPCSRTHYWGWNVKAFLKTRAK